MMNTRRNVDAIRQLMKSPVWADDGAVNQDERAEPFPSLVVGITNEAYLDNRGHVSRSAQTSKIFLFGRERRKDRQ